MIMRLQNIKSAILIILVCFSIIAGCAAIQGKQIKTYESEYHDTVRASSDTLKSLKIPVTEKLSDELKTVINAKRFDGSPVTIEVVRIEQNLTLVSVRAGAGAVPDNLVSTQIHKFINETLIQQPRDGPKQAGNMDTEGTRAPYDGASKQGISEENLDYGSAGETILTASATDVDDQNQNERSPKLAEIYTDSVFIIFFNQDSNSLSIRAMQKLDRVAEIMLNNQEIRTTLNGYTDSYGSPSYNMVISENRAKMVKVYLIGKGVDPEKIATEGYGAAKFLASNKTKAGRQFNRRVEIELNNPETK